MNFKIKCDTHDHNLLDVNYDEYDDAIISDYILKVKHENGCQLSYLIDDVVTDISSVKAGDTEYLDNIKTELIEAEKKKCYESVIAGFTFDGQVFQCAEKDQINYMGLLLKKSLIVAPVKITLLNGDLYDLQPSDIDAFTTAAFSHKETILASYKTKVQSINNCTTVAELSAVIG